MPNSRNTQILEQIETAEELLAPQSLQNSNAFEAFDRDELAEYLGTSKRYIEELDARRTGPPRLKLAGKWRYPKSGVDSWLKAQIKTQYRAQENTEA